MSRQFVSGIHEFAAAHDVPLIHFAKGQRKDDVMAEHLWVSRAACGGWVRAQSSSWVTAELGAPAAAAGHGDELDPYRGEPVRGEGFDLVAPQRPRRPGGLAFLVDGGDGQQGAAGRHQPADVGDGLAAGRVGQCLRGEDLDHQIERSQPVLRQVEQISGLIPGTGEPPPRDVDRRRGNVETQGAEPEPGEVRGVGAQAAADHNGPPAGSVKAARPLGENRVRVYAIPRHVHAPGRARGVKAVEPAGRITSRLRRQPVSFFFPIGCH
jgi:hypothetical protein